MKILIGLALLLAAEIGIRVTCGVMTPLPAKLPERSLDEIPKQAGGWTGEDLPADKPLYEHTGAAVMLDRKYSSAIGDTVTANFGIWLDTETSLPHSPELCYTTAGWQVDDQKQIKIPLHGGNTRARLLTLDRTGQTIYVLYCYQIGDRVVLDSNELRAVRQSLWGSKTQLPPVVKMMLQSTNPDPSAAERQLVDLASHLMPTLALYQ